MKIKTSEATGLQLDWGVAVAQEYAPEIKYETVFVPAEKRGWPIEGVMPFDHTDPRVCMELIACEYGKVWKVEAIPRTPTPTALAMGFSSVGADVTKAYGKNLAEAVARCVIAMKLGDEFECPDELGVQS